LLAEEEAVIAASIKQKPEKRTRASLEIEILAIRHQLNILRRRSPPPVYIEFVQFFASVIWRRG